MEIATLWTVLTEHPWLTVPLTFSLLLSILLWFGRIRQPAAINLIAIGLIMPCINLSMIATSAVVASDNLTGSLLSLLAG